MSNKTELAPFSGMEPQLHTGELRVLADRINERDQRSRDCSSHWLQNGLDLLAAKRLVGHGKFEAWCRTELGYGKSKVEKSMRAADLLEPFVKSGTVTDLPPPTVFYLLSAPSVPQEIRNEFVPRVLAGEKVGPEVRRALSDHRQQAKRQEAPAVVAEPTIVKSEAEEPDLKRQRQSSARLAALGFIQARLDDDLPELMNLVADAGPGSVFSLDAERALKEFAWDMAEPKILGDGEVHVDGGMQAEASEAEVLESAGSSDATGRDTGGANHVKATEPSPRAVASDQPSVADRPTHPVHPASKVLESWSEWTAKKADRRSMRAQSSAPVSTELAPSAQAANGHDG